jgi:hypothetical protein
MHAQAYYWSQYAALPVLDDTFHRFMDGFSDVPPDEWYAFVDLKPWCSLMGGLLNILGLPPLEARPYINALAPYLPTDKERLLILERVVRYYKDEVFESNFQQFNSSLLLSMLSSKG